MLSVFWGVSFWEFEISGGEKVPCNHCLFVVSSWTWGFRWYSTGGLVHSVKELMVRRRTSWIFSHPRRSIFEKCQTLPEICPNFQRSSTKCCKGILTVFQGNGPIKIGEKDELWVWPHGLELFRIRRHVDGWDMNERDTEMIGRSLFVFPSSFVYVLPRCGQSRGYMCAAI